MHVGKHPNPRLSCQSPNGSLNAISSLHQYPGSGSSAKPQSGRSRSARIQVPRQVTGAAVSVRGPVEPRCVAWHGFLRRDRHPCCALRSWTKLSVGLFCLEVPEPLLPVCLSVFPQSSHHFTVGTLQPLGITQLPAALRPGPLPVKLEAWSQVSGMPRHCCLLCSTPALYWGA